MSAELIGQLGGAAALLLAAIWQGLSWRRLGIIPEPLDRPLALTIPGMAVRPGDLIGLGPGFALRVEQTVFDGGDGLLVGRIACPLPVYDDRHGNLRNGQPYAAVVTATGELRWLHDNDETMEMV